MTERTDDPADRPNFVQHLIWRGIPIAALLVVLILSYVYWVRTDHGPTAQAAPAPQPAPLPVDTVVVEPRNVPLRPTFLGQTEASQVVEIRSRVRGFLLERAFEEGATVRQGQVLFRIDPKPFQAELDMARASLGSAEARLARARQELQRYEQLFARNTATANELDQIRTEERVAAAQVQLETARVQRAELDLGYTTISAPITGVIGQALKDVGTYVDDGPNALLSVLRQVEPMYVRYAVSEQDLLRWQRQRESGQVNVPEVDQLQLEITLGDGRPYPHPGRINFVDVLVDPATGTSVIRGTVPNPENTLRPGQFVHATVLGIERLGAILVPQKAVIHAPNGAMVYVVNDQNTIEPRPVTLGEWQGEGWVIESGLRGGERVVVDRLMQVRPGMVVTVTQAPPTTAPTTRPAAAQ
jgi:membrane fusion protein (multidrug efflux system)